MLDPDRRFVGGRALEEDGIGELVSIVEAVAVFEEGRSVIGSAATVFDREAVPGLEEVVFLEKGIAGRIAVLRIAEVVEIASS